MWLSTCRGGTCGEIDAPAVRSRGHVLVPFVLADLLGVNAVFDLCSQAAQGTTRSGPPSSGMSVPLVPGLAGPCLQIEGISKQEGH